MESQFESVKSSRVISLIKHVIKEYFWHILLIVVCIALTMYSRPIAIESRGGDLAPGGEFGFLFIPLIFYGFKDSYKGFKEEWDR